MIQITDQVVKNEMKSKQSLVGIISVSYLFRSRALLSFRRPRARAEERLMEGSISYQEENLCDVSGLSGVMSPRSYRPSLFWLSLLIVDMCASSPEMVELRLWKPIRSADAPPRFSLPPCSHSEPAVATAPTICGETTRIKNLCFVHCWSISLLPAGVRDTVQHI